jgi:3-oxoacyl-[acyl-carrier protein] reductase
MSKDCFENEVVLITGANSGIGAATARAFAREGASVVAHYLGVKPGASPKSVSYEHAVLGKPAADALVDEILLDSGRAVAVEGDLLEPNTASALFDLAEREFGRVDILVNNAAHCTLPDDILHADTRGFDNHFHVNARAPMLLIAEFVRRYNARRGSKGSIVNISTDAAQNFPTQICYGASKAALEALTRSIAFEIGPLGIRVNAVAPGPVQTGYITPQMEKDLLPWIPLRRLGMPEDIADVVVFLASDKARWLTGAVLRVSGGHVV